MLPLSFVTSKSYIIYQAAKTKTKGSYLSGNPIKFPIYTASTTVILWGDDLNNAWRKHCGNPLICH